MAENKQYISQEQDKGGLMISEDVIATLIAHAASEVEGVVGSDGSTSDIFGKRNKGIKIEIDQDDALTIDLNISVQYGYNVMIVAKAVQNAIISSLEAMAGLTINAINVNVVGIVCC